MMKTRYSDQPPFEGGPSIFLAGPTPRAKTEKPATGLGAWLSRLIWPPEPPAPSWRPEALRILEKLGFEGTVVIPERLDWTTQFNYDDQFEWELTGLKNSTVVAFWIPREMKKMPALTTNYEFSGLLHTTPEKVVYGRPDWAVSCRYADKLFKKLAGRDYSESLEATLRDAVALCDLRSGKALAVVREVLKPGSPNFPQWLVSDQHLGESEATFNKRGRHNLFRTVEEQNEYIVARHNAVVGKNDVVWFVGDVVCKHNPEALPWIARLNGRKVLIKGNHDVHGDAEYAKYFEEIVADGDGKLFEIDGVRCWVNHYPSLARPDCFNIVGHVHAAWQFQLNMLNVSVDAHHFTPVDTSQIKTLWMDKVEHSDDDIYSAYLEQNRAFRHARGIKGGYFQKRNKKPQA